MNIKLISNKWNNKFNFSTIEECYKELSKLDYISLDTETEGFDPHTKSLLMLQLGNKDIQFIIDCKTIDIKPLKNVLESKTVLMHNAKFDWRFLYHYGIDIKNIYDTFLGEVILYTGYNLKEKDKPNFISTSLQGVVKKYCNEDLDKTIRGKIHIGITDDVIIYAAKDIIYLEDIMNKQLEEMKDKDLLKVKNLEMRAVRVFAKMEYDGILFSREKLQPVIEELNNINKELKDSLDNIIVSESNKTSKLKKYTKVQLDLFNEVDKTIINWSSSAQKTKILNELGINVDSVNDKTLQLNKTKHPIIPLFIEYSKYTKLTTSFGEPLLKFINPVTQRIHAGVWQILTTGRISMQDPNLQQIPSHSKLGRAIKSCFISKPGYKIVSADFSSFELRIIAEYSQDPLWVNTFNNDGDLHSILCTETFGIPIEDVKKPFPPKPDISYRFLQKTLNFGLSYGMSKFKFSDTAQIPVDEADKIIKKFFSKVPKVEKFLNSLAKSGVKNGYIRTDLHYRRIRYFPNLDKENFKSVGEVERASKNSIPQGTNANTVKQALIDIQDIIDNNNYPVIILLTVHDEIITECREDFAEEWSKILSNTMIEAAKLSIKSIPVKVDPVISDYWTD